MRDLAPEEGWVAKLCFLETIHDDLCGHFDYLDVLIVFIGRLEGQVIILVDTLGAGAAGEELTLWCVSDAVLLAGEDVQLLDVDGASEHVLVLLIVLLGVLVRSELRRLLVHDLGLELLVDAVDVHDFYEALEIQLQILLLLQERLFVVRQVANDDEYLLEEAQLALLEGPHKVVLLLERQEEHAPELLVGLLKHVVETRVLEHQVLELGALLVVVLGGEVLRECLRDLRQLLLQLQRLLTRLLIGECKVLGDLLDAANKGLLVCLEGPDDLV